MKQRGSGIGKGTEIRVGDWRETESEGETERQWDWERD